MQLELKLTDGGRSKYYKCNDVRDCVTRAIAIASGKDYDRMSRKPTNFSRGMNAIFY